MTASTSLPLMRRFADPPALLAAALHDVEKAQPQDLTGWIGFMAEMIEITLEQTWKRLEGLRSGKTGEKIHLTPRQEKLLKLLRSGPMRPVDLQKELELTKGGLHFLLKPLLTSGLVQQRRLQNWCLPDS